MLTSLARDRGPEQVLTDCSPQQYRQPPTRPAPLHGTSFGSSFELVEALREPGSQVLLIGPGKKSVGKVPSITAARAAVTHGTAASFAIELRAGIVCADVDLDGPAGVAAKDNLISWLSAHRWGYVVVESGQPGHFHVYARLRYGNDKSFARAAKKARAAFAKACVTAGITSQVRTRQALVRPPSAPHPTMPGAVATLVDPVAPFDALVRLGLVGAPTADADSTTKSKHRRATKKAPRAKRQNGPSAPSRLLTGLDPAYRVLALHAAGREDLRHKDGRLDGSKALSALAWHAAWKNFTLDQWLDLALNPAHKGCRKAQGRNDNGTYARESYARAQQAVATARAEWHGRPVDPHLDAHLAAFTQDMEAAAWTAQRRPAVLAVTAYLTGLARLAGTATGIGASERQIADGTGMERDRVHDTLHAMRTDGDVPGLRVTRAYGQDGVAAHEWQLVALRRVGGAPVSGGNCNPTTVGHPAFTAGGLDKSGWLTYQALTDTPAPVAQIVVATTHLTDPAQATKQRSRTAVARLRALAAVGLAAQDKDGAWVRAHALADTQAALDAAALTLGVQDAVANLKAKHVAERAGFADREQRLIPETSLARAADDAPVVDWTAWQAEQDAWSADRPSTPLVEQVAPSVEDEEFLQAVFPLGMTHGQARRTAASLPGHWEAAPAHDGTWTVVQMLVDPDTGEIYDRDVTETPAVLRLVA